MSGRIPGHAPRVGAELRSARERRGWDLDALAANLRIRSSYLEAIEDGRVADLPGNAYALGFLRTYAAALGLDPGEVTRRFRAEVAEVNTKTELTFPAPVPDRGVPAGVVVVLGLVLMIGAYVGWYQFADRAAPPNPVAPVPARLARLADPTALAPSHLPVPAHLGVSPSSAPAASVAPGTAGSVTPDRTTAAKAQASGAGGAAPSSTAGVSEVPESPAPAMAAAGPEGSAAAPPSPVASSASSPAPTPLSAPTPAPAGGSPASNAAIAAVASLAPPASAATRPSPPSGTIIVHATEPAWIEVRDATGAVVFTRLMQSGESWTAPHRAGLILTTGNAGGTELIVDGRPAPPLGGPGMVVRDQPLDASLIKSGALPAQIAAAAAGVPAFTPASIRSPQGSDSVQ